MAKAIESMVVLITGCSSGIGRATALRLAKAGYTVYATARRVESIRDLQAVGCNTLALDVTNDTSMQQAVQTIEAEHGAVDVLINNAGYSESGAVEELSSERLRRQFETNVFGVHRLIQLVLPGMRDKGFGKIVNLSSMGGRLTFPGGGAYHASKYAIEALSDALRFEVRGFGIDVVLVEPGLIRTGFSEAAVGSMTEALAKPSPYGDFNQAVALATKEVYEKGVFSKLGGDPDDVARIIEHAITARRPRARYAVTASAKVLLAQRAMMPDWAWDAFLRAQFPQPGHDAAKSDARAPAGAS
ncbi:oxidoreductase [Paraliomyxa miuraensis]|uniref:oxidoreductase n=1 Tax=Paraliomyxa miuraensis TaxID=376150 RepID=UPI00224F6512|nr:oxidoreductase [Paraliomyxa miuraensis]MCX4239136.1 oxidoreductase [Paraliomyxa miuraensis]